MSSSSSPTPLYSDILATIKELIELRNRLNNKPTEKDICIYKLYIKVWEAFTRIKEHPEVLMDTINSVNLSESGKTSVPTENKEQKGKPIVLSLFDSKSSDDETDREIEPEALFRDSPKETLPDDQDVTHMLKKSILELQRALNNRNYTTASSISSGSDSEEAVSPKTKKNKKNTEDTEHVQLPVPLSTSPPLPDTSALTISTDDKEKSLSQRKPRHRRNIPRGHSDSESLELIYDGDNDSDSDDNDIYNITPAAAII